MQDVVLLYKTSHHLYAYFLLQPRNRTKIWKGMTTANINWPLSTRQLPLPSTPLPSGDFKN